MRTNLQPVETFPLPEQDPGRPQPELQGIQGGGEAELVPEAMARRAGFHVVTDVVEASSQSGEAPTADMPETEGAVIADTAEIVAFVDVKSGRTKRYAGSKTVEMAVASDSEEDDGDYYKRRGGGGGAYYWFLKTQAEKYHEEGCNCNFCGH